MRFEYKTIAGEIDNVGGHGNLDPSSICIHHAGFKRSDGDADPAVIASTYSRGHESHMPYHIFIPFNSKDRFIYITQWLNLYTHHCGNLEANQDSLAICVDGNFQEQEPLEIQKQKLRQVLDDFKDQWFTKNGFLREIADINPASKEIHTYYGKSVNELFYHNEAGLQFTWCSGASLIPLVKDYREKGGNVTWGKYKNDPIVEKPSDNLYRIFVGGKQIGAFENFDNAFDKFLSVRTQNPKVTQKGKDLTSQFLNEMKKLDAANAEISKLKGEIEKITRKIGDLEKNIKVANEAKAQLAKEKTLVETVNASLLERAEKAENSIKKLQSELTRTQMQLATLKRGSFLDRLKVLFHVERHS